MSSSVSILGIPFEPMTQAEARRRLVGLIQSEKCAKVYTPNPQILWKTKKDPSLARLLNNADLLLPDGTGVILASRLLRTPLPQRITGIDTAEWLLRYGAEHGRSVYFLGGKTGVAEAAARRMRKKIPTLRVAGTHHGYFDKSGKENEAVLAHIQACRPDLLLVCFGFPEQETWIARYADTLPTVRLAMGLGGTLDVWAGRVKRAPRPFRTMGLEWLWRALREPRRIKDLACLPMFLWHVKTSQRTLPPS